SNRGTGGLTDARSLGPPGPLLTVPSFASVCGEVQHRRVGTQAFRPAGQGPHESVTGSRPVRPLHVAYEHGPHRPSGSPPDPRRSLYVDRRFRALPFRRAAPQVAVAGPASGCAGDQLVCPSGRLHARRTPRHLVGSATQTAGAGPTRGLG